MLGRSFCAAEFFPNWADIDMIVRETVSNSAYFHAREIILYTLIGTGLEELQESTDGELITRRSKDAG